MNKIEQRIKEEIRERVQRRLNKVPEDVIEFLEEHMPGGIMYVAGGYLNPDNPNDMDIYPVNENLPTFTTMSIKRDGFSFAYNAGDEKNTLSFSYGGKIYQICKYIKPSLKDLVDSFDFAHIQAGCLVEIGTPLVVKDVYVSEDYIVARTTGKSFYTGTEYPLSSLIRTFKYAKREELGNRKNVSNIVLEILSDIIERGYSSYDDFKDQLASIDLLLKKDIDESVLKKFVSAMLYRGIVDKADKRFVAVAGDDAESAEGEDDDGNDSSREKSDTGSEAAEDLQFPF